jgi:hypothetical protein
VGAQPRGFFFTRGQSFGFQRSMVSVRHVPVPDAPVSGGSNSGGALTARYDPDDSGLPTRARSAPRSVPSSRDWYGSRGRGVPGAATSPSAGAGSVPTWAGVLAKSEPARRLVPLAAVPGASAARSWRRIGSGAPLRSETSRYRTKPRLAVGDPPADRHCPSAGA